MKLLILVLAILALCGCESRHTVSFEDTKIGDEQTQALTYGFHF